MEIAALGVVKGNGSSSLPMCVLFLCAQYSLNQGRVGSSYGPLSTKIGEKGNGERWSFALGFLH